ncbi:putative ABC transport system ATP-binding protein [Evansella caseinilytica]|uniref:Putative ABC transport system ATP-binding protein n=1 Tax=Evansella caseinilytica TaxID=1503961 RepID=A0A1H3SWN0_9BACI|nr:ATP-binding cassette domain-containing protein [Evansella caseinilytica]SDZ42372.1 putative ABC transport system ATP-binding protein [Evansella caseinilytica]
MIKLTNVNKMFHSVEPVHALAEVSFHVKNANWVTVLGPSGSGKTTLLNVISGMEQIDSGDMDVDGQSLLSISAAELQIFAATPSAIYFRIIDCLINFPLSITSCCRRFHTVPGKTLK